MPNNKFSIIMPTYNRAFCIERAINSLLAQTYQEFELIIIDDGSSDNTENLVKEKYKAELEKQKIIYKKYAKNKGVCNARNEGLKLAKNEWIGYLDTDNTIVRDYLETFSNAIKENPNHKTFYAQLQYEDDTIIGKDFSYKSLCEKNYIDMGVFVHHKSLVKKCGKFDTKLKRLVDWDLILRYTKKYKPYFIKKVLLNYSNDTSYRRITNTETIDKTLERITYKHNTRFIERIFSIRNNQRTCHKIINIFGIQIKLKSKKLELLSFINRTYSDSKSTEYKNFIEHDKNANYKIKPIAFYLPQYYTFKENDAWHGKGFTEWTNVSKAKPLFQDHYQPHIPYDVGFYNLETTNIMHRQIELAKNYGIYGFSFYYYWFRGKKIMEKPTYNYLNDKSLNFPFCLCWAVENWTKLWDGGNREILMESTLEENDFDNFWNDILPFFKDKRYIKIDNKPILQIYKPQQFDKKVIIKFIEFVRKKSIEAGFNGIYLMWAITRDLCKKENLDISELGFDACLEFPPHGLTCNAKTEYNIKKIKPKGYNVSDCKGVVLDFNDFIENQRFINPQFDTNIYRGIFPSWDNTARKRNSGFTCYHNSTPSAYEKWLTSIVEWTEKNRKPEERFIFINAWNEWAEGAHLEPDMKYGYAYLEKTQNVLERNLNLEDLDEEK